MKIDARIETPKLKIVKATKDLAPDVYELVSAAATELEAQKGFTHWLSYYTPEVVAHKFEEGDVYVGYIGEELAAVGRITYAIPEYYGEEEMALFTPVDGIVGYIGMLAVKPSFRGIGLGRQMVEMRLQEAQKAGAVAVRFDARAEDEALIRFHRSIGYKEVGRIEYEPGESYYFFEMVF